MRILVFFLAKKKRKYFEKSIGIRTKECFLLEDADFTGNDETAEDSGASDKDLEYRLKIPWVVIPVPVRSRSPACAFFVGKPLFIRPPGVFIYPKSLVTVWLQAFQTQIFVHFCSNFRCLRLAVIGTNVVKRHSQIRMSQYPLQHLYVDSVSTIIKD